MALFGAIGDARRIRLGQTGPNSGGQAQPLWLDVENATFTGSTTITFKNLDSVLGVVVEQVDGSSPGVAAQNFTYTVSNNAVTVFAWMPTSNANPTLIAATGAATVTVLAVGVRRQGQSS